MIVVITSWAPTVAFRKPAIPPQSAPARVAPPMQRSTWIGAGRPDSDVPSQTATTEPTMYWPWPPMLNIPQRNANATARPVSTSTVNVINVYCRLPVAEQGIDVALPLEEQKLANQLSPVPLKISR